jgi:Ran GTPase-activating protein (RanGAP) involved in mRNA processing and transport
VLIYCVTGAYVCNTQINLSYNRLSAESARVLAPAIAASHHLNSVDLGNNFFDQDAALTLLAAMKNTMLKIGMCGCHLGVSGAKRVANYLIAGNSITELNLRQNQFGLQGWTIIFNALCNSPANKVVTWDLSYEALGPAITKPLARLIVASRSLTQVM